LSLLYFGTGGFQISIELNETTSVSLLGLKSGLCAPPCAYNFIPAGISNQDLITL
jgi:hypothetical protein